MELDIQKKRGRKPKNFTFEEVPVHESEKKKRGRKKKYQIENFEKIFNRGDQNNFNHHIVYSDDDAPPPLVEESCVKKVSFGNLNITVSKKIETEDINDFKLKTRTNFDVLINKDEYSSDEEKEVPIESFIKMNEKNYTENKRYTPKIVSECVQEESIKKIKVITTTKDQVKSTEDWPQTCNTCCWWCCHTFEGSPCTLPIKYDSLRKRFMFVGLFCSWNCVKSYNFERNDHRASERSMLITLLVQQLHGITEAVCIKKAPPRQALKMFGGHLDISEFRNSRNVDSYGINLINFNYIYPEVTEVTNTKSKPEKKNLRLSRPN